MYTCPFIQPTYLFYARQARYRDPRAHTRTVILYGGTSYSLLALAFLGQPLKAMGL